VIRTERISAIMTADVHAVQVDAAPSQVRDLLRHHRFHHVPVLDGGIVVGMLSSADVAALGLEAWGVDEQTVDAELDASFDLRALMSHDVVTAHPDEPVLRAAELLADGSIHAIPVVNGKNELVGLVTSTDLIRYLYHAFR